MTSSAAAAAGLAPEMGRAGGKSLPLEPNSFIGRRRELSEVRRLLTENRLVTLTGVGGTGKTRLARRLAADLRRAFPDGTWFVDLTDIRGTPLPSGDTADPDYLAYLVTAVLGLHDEPGASPLRLLSDRLAGQHMLLVLDNCEHLVTACAVLADALLQASPRLRILATSRESLAVAGEALFAVPPLLLPDRHAEHSVADLVGYEAVALFTARARAVQPSFDLTRDNQEAVVELCHRLDGLPLSIELAAARTRVLAPQQILDRLTDRFAVLNRGGRTSPERQRTLRACVDWSYELCSDSERRLWARLTVFAGAFELDAVEGVGVDEHLPGVDLLDVLSGLVDKSIIVSEDNGPVVRYRMLETIRDFGRGELGPAEHAALRRRHHDWYQQLVARAHAEWVSDRQPYWIARLGREHPNLRAAVEFCLSEPGQAENALRMITCLPVHYWWSRRLLGECRRWLDRALAQADAPTGLRARSLLLASDLAFVHGDAGAATDLLGRGEELARRLDDLAATAHACYTRGIGALHRNDLRTSVECLERALAGLGNAADRDSELDLYLRVLIGLAVAAAMAGERDRAAACREEMLALTDRLGSGFYRSSALWSCGVVTWLDGDPQLAAEQVQESLRLRTSYGLGDDFGTALCVEVLAWIAATRRQHRRAAVLLGVADTLRDGQGTNITSFRHLFGHHVDCERQVRDALGEQAFAEAVLHGRGLACEDALAYALGDRRRAPSATAPAGSTPLTRRELEIAGLVARGLSNKDIASTLVISPRTAEGHVENIMTKLGFARRSQIAAWVTARRAE